MRLTSVRKALHALIIGPPGSGKGTVASRVVKQVGMVHVSSGDAFRREIENDSELGRKVKGIIKEGKLVSDDLVSNLILSQIKAISSEEPWLLDGYPRTVEQATYLDQHMQIDTVINLDVPFDTIKERLTSRWTHLPSGRVYNNTFNPPLIGGIDDITGEKLIQRDDDKPETVQKRLEAYSENTQPILEFYETKGVLHSFSGTKTDDIWPFIKQYLLKAVKDHS